MLNTIKKFTKASLSYDCALYYDFKELQKFEAEGVLVALRTDIGTMIDKFFGIKSAIPMNQFMCAEPRHGHPKQPL